MPHWHVQVMYVYETTELHLQMSHTLHTLHTYTTICQFNSLQVFTLGSTVACFANMFSFFLIATLPYTLHCYYELAVCGMSVSISNFLLRIFRII